MFDRCFHSEHVGVVALHPSNIFVCSLFLLTLPIKTRGLLTFFLPSDVSCEYGGGWGDVNVREQVHSSCMLYRSRGGVMFTLMLNCTLSAHYVDHVGWVGYGYGWGDVNVRVSLYAW